MTVPSLSNDLAQRARGIRLLTCDVDGVLTDGRLYYGDDGREMKAFSSLDGVGIKMLAAAGVTVAWITGSNAPAVAHRAKALGVRRLLQGADDKLTPWDRLRAELDLPGAACAHIGDDLPDLPVIAHCGLGVAVPHAPTVVKNRAHYVTRREGGCGAVREICELILAAQGALDAQQEAFAMHDLRGARP
jgi:3-deoxy-D-manno-octulosonate 8-phosphate phosphatase (KDO 8-P phosphatase)